MSSAQIAYLTQAMNLMTMCLLVTVQQVTNGTQPFVNVSHEEISIVILPSMAITFASGTKPSTTSFNA